MDKSASRDRNGGITLRSYTTIDRETKDGTPDLVAYVMLPDLPVTETAACVKSTLRLLDLVPGHSGPDVYLDFNADNCLIGIEIIP